MPITDLKCPGCETPLHTDCLLEGECLLGGCGEELDDQFYEENNVDGFYR